MNENELTLAERNRLRTTEKVQNALESFKRSKKVLNIAEVSKKAGITRKTLYNREDLMALVRESQALIKDKTKPDRNNEKKMSVQEKRLLVLRNENKRLKEEQKLLLEQNKILTEQAIDLQQRQVSLEESLLLIRQGKVTPLKQSTN
ncbi:hypothetical protein OB236_07175 [Paenibacillus sp. WQ 127069]|uniref:Transposase n=1 Tax=Paenibacillus baimaensis TaxID=2982185 RepID=A0ABT2UE05_9BACL|nr:hypothetical protein [Paenibacillus sp. WQ 127069]MCU6791904.1 hypothetical protein [Paenibacillus sp. WQ 127069]